MDVIAYYDKLIEENNAPFRDPPALQDYMNQWDGQIFVDSLLREGGIFCLSIDKGQKQYIDMGTRRIKIYPDTLDNIISLVSATTMSVVNVLETAFAHIVVCTK